MDDSVNESTTKTTKTIIKYTLEGFFEESLLPDDYFEEFSLERRIAQGSFGKIYEVSSQNDSKILYAAKKMDAYISPNPKEASSLSIEKYIMERLHEFEGFPKAISFFTRDGEETLIMTLLGPNLQELCERCGGRFSLKTTLMIGLQALRRLEALHEIGYLHRDVKPANFVIGLGAARNVIHMIDFGLSVPYLKKDGTHISFKENARVGGCFYYLSVYGHLKLRPSRRDCLISLGFMLMHFLLGKLPWDDVQGSFEERIKAMMKEKVTRTPGKLCEGLPEEFVKYFEYVLDLAFQKKPDYRYLSGLLRKVMENWGFEEDGDFDWNDKGKGIDLNGRKILQDDVMKYVKRLDDSDSLA